MDTRNRAGSYHSIEENSLSGFAEPLLEKPQSITLAGVFIPVALAVSGGLIFGFNTAISAGTQDIVIKDEFFPADRNDSGKINLLSGVFVASILAGCMVGSMSGGVLADALGRKWVVVMCAIVCVLGVGLSAGSIYFWMLIVSRSILGLSVGVTSSIVPLYTSEVSPPALRGSIGTMFQVSVCLGILLAYVTSIAFCPGESPSACYAKDKNVWRWQFLFGAVPGVMMGILVFFLPESPMWLEARKKNKEAVEGGGVEQKTSVFAILAPQHRKKVILGFTLAIGQQLTGINGIIFYAPVILEEQGVGPFTVGIGAWNLLSVLLSLALVEYLGRRPLMVSTLGIMTISNAIMALGCWLLPDYTKYITIFHLAVFVCSFEIGPGPLFFVIVGEIFPQSVRGVAVSLMVLANWTCNLILSLTFRYVLEACGVPITFGIFCIVGAGSFVMTFMLLEETKGKKLEN